MRSTNWVILYCSFLKPVEGNLENRNGPEIGFWLKAMFNTNFTNNKSVLLNCTSTVITADAYSLSISKNTLSIDQLR